MGGVPGDPLMSGGSKAAAAGATMFARSCVVPGVALGLRVLDLTVEVPVNKWFCHCVRTFLQPKGLLSLMPPLAQAAMLRAAFT